MGLRIVVLWAIWTALVVIAHLAWSLGSGAVAFTTKVMSGVTSQVMTVHERWVGGSMAFWAAWLVGVACIALWAVLRRRVGVGTVEG